MRPLKRMILAATAAISIAPPALADTFTYQGRLDQGGAPANGTYDFDFTLWDQAAGGVQVGGPSGFNDLPVNDGLFTTLLGFSESSLKLGRWMEITVNGTTLSPRQWVGNAPFALQLEGLDRDENDFFGIGTTAGPARLTVSENNAEAILANSVFFDAIVGSSGAVGKAGVYGGNDNGYGVQGVSTNGFAGYFEGRGSFSGHTTIGLEGVQVTGAEMFGVHSPLDVGFAGMYVSTAGGGGSPFYGYAAGQDVDAFHYFNGNADQWRLVCGTDRLVVNRQNGRVGIGTTSPAFLLEVSGSAGKPGGGSWSTSSDARLKKDVTDLDGALDRLLALRGVEFEYIDPAAFNELPGRRIGVIAQEVETVFPDWVDESGHGFKAVTFRGFEALTVEGLRKLRNENDDLRAANDELRDRLAALEALVARIGGDQ